MADKWNLEGVAVDTLNNMTLSNGLTVVGTVLNVANLPTADSGLAAGDVWLDSGVLTISAGS